MKLLTKKSTCLTAIILVLLLNIGTVFAGQYTTHTISSYRYDQFSTSGESSVDLYDSMRRLKGILIFLPLEASQLPNASKDSRGLIRLYYTTDSLKNVVDLLRNENPIVLRYWDGAGDNSHIGTYFREITGEGE